MFKPTLLSEIELPEDRIVTANPAPPPLPPGPELSLSQLDEHIRALRAVTLRLQNGPRPAALAFRQNMPVEATHPRPPREPYPFE